MTTPQPSSPPPYGTPPTGSQSGYPGFAQPYDGVGYGAPVKPPKPPAKVWDVVLTIVLLVALAAFTALASFAGLFLIMASDPCGTVLCSTDLITLGWLIGTLVPWVVLIAAAVWAIVFLVKRKLAFYIPIVGAVGVTAVLVIAFMITAAGVPSTG